MDDSITYFATVAHSFCAWAEAQPEAFEVEGKMAFRLLADLSSAILATPSLGCGEDIESKRISNKEWNNIYNRFGSLPFNYYSTFLHPTKVNKEESVVGNLADDLADIYRDIKEGLWLYNHGHTVEAVWLWRNTFQIHWGRHATNALYVLYTWWADESIDI